MEDLAFDWDFPHPFALDRVITPSDMDELNHTNNIVYVNWCQEAAWAHSEKLGLGIDTYRELDRAMVVIQSEFQYLKPSKSRDEIKIGTWLVSWDKKLSMTRKFQIIRTDGTTLFRGTMIFACIQISSGKPRRLPREFFDGYGLAIVDKTRQ